MNAYAALSLLIFVVNTGLAFLVLSRDPQGRVHRLFMLFSLAVAYWGLTEFGYRQAESYHVAYLWLKFSALCPFVVSFFLHFVLTYTKSGWLRHPLAPWLIYAPALVFSAVDLPTSWITGTPVHKYWGWTYSAPYNVWYHLNALWSIVVLLTLVGMCYRYFRAQSDPTMRTQAGFVTLGLCVPVTLGALSEIVLPYLRISIPEFTTAGFAVANACIGYAMWRHELFQLSPRAAADRIIDTMSDALFIVDAAGAVQEVNDAARRMLGARRETLVGAKARELITATDGAAERFIDFAAGVRDVEAALRRPDGIEVPISVSSAPMHDKRNQPRGAVLIARDITERQLARQSLQKAHDELEERVIERTAQLDDANRKLHTELVERRRTEAALAEEKERLDVTLRSIGDGVITADTAGRIVLLNDAAAELTGWTREEARGRPIVEVLCAVDETSRKPIPDPVEAILRAQGVMEIQPHTILIARNGSERRIADSGAPIRDAQGRVVGAVIVFRDITEKQHLEDELLKAKKLESVGLLAGGLAHDFNNVLTGIINSLFVAKMGMQRDQEPYRLVNMAEESAFRASRLTKKLLTFARGGDPVRQQADVRELIEDSVGFALSGSPVDYTVDIADDVLPVQIDKGQIDQVFNSLVANAAQAMPDGGTVTISARNVTIGMEGLVNERGPSQHIPPGIYVKISVSDQGTGIPPEYLDRVFDPYYSTKPGASGLGLAIVYSIVKKHDGHVSVASTPGKGSTFSIYLPASSEAAPSLNLPAGPEETVEPACILLMDDEPVVRVATAALLAKLGYTVVTAVDGREALSRYGEALDSPQPFDMVILDVTVPGGMGGKECMLHLRRLDPHVKAIVSSGYANSDVLAEHRVLGFCGVLPKPYTVEQLSETIRRVLATDA